MIKLEAISDEMRADAVKILARTKSRSKKAMKAKAIFKDDDITVLAAFTTNDPWTHCVLVVDGDIVGVGASKRCTYAKSEDKPNSDTGKLIAFSRAVRGLLK